MSAEAKCRACGQPEDLSEPLVNGVCVRCIRRQSAPPPALPVKPQKPAAPQPTPPPALDPVAILAVVLIVCGMLAFSFFALAYDTTVGVDHGERVHNLGLLQNRLLGASGGLTAIVVGALLCSAYKIASVGQFPKQGAAQPR